MRSIQSNQLKTESKVRPKGFELLLFDSSMFYMSASLIFLMYLSLYINKINGEV
jgi:hypothetical protein